MSKDQNSKPKSKQKFALLSLMAILVISVGAISITAFNEQPTSANYSITGSDTPTFVESTEVIAHYSIVANDDAQFGDGVPNPKLLHTQQAEIHTASYDPDGLYPNNIPIQYHGDKLGWGGVGLVEKYECPDGATINYDNNKTCIGPDGTIVERLLVTTPGEEPERIHNRVVDEGEQFLLAQVFQSGAVKEASDGDLFSTICVTIEVAFVDTSEAETANGFDTGNTTTETNCIEDTAVVITSGVATIGPLTFDAPTHVGNSDEITGFGICQATTTPYADCEEGQPASAGEIFSVIDSAERTLESAETVDITYTFDISSAGA